MDNKKQVISGFIITIIIFLTANLIGRNIHFNNGIIPYSFMTGLIMLILSCSAIWIMKKDLRFQMALPKFKKIFKPFFIGIIISFVVNFIMTIIGNLIDVPPESHPLLAKMNFLQVFLFVFIWASITEEILFRGFFLNSLRSLNNIGINIFKIRISLPVIISAVLFGLAHLTLLLMGASWFFLLRTILFTIILGIAAGYYQQKYNNTSYAIIVHMGGNVPAVLGLLIMNMSA